MLCFFIVASIIIIYYNAVKDNKYSIIKKFMNANSPKIEGKGCTTA